MEVEGKQPTSPAIGEIPVVPVIDVEDVDEERVVALIAKASSEIGMFQIINHGIPNEVVAKLQSVGKEFFELPQQEKERYSKLPGSREGYGVALTKEDEGKETKSGEHRVDHIFHNIWPPSSINYGFWPTNPPSYREANEEYAKYLRVISEKLLKWLSLGLGLEGDEIKKAMGGENVNYLLKINHYPPCPQADLAVGVPPHTDMSGMTLLVPNDVQGLQLCSDGQHWFDVTYVPNGMVVHIGDQLEVISNGKYKAVFHRSKLDKDRTRLSWPTFVEPPSEHIVGPIPKLVSQDNPPKYKTKRYCDFVYCKLKRIPQ